MITRQQSEALQNLFGQHYIAEILEECKKRNIVRKRSGKPVTDVDVSQVFKGHRSHDGIESVIWHIAALKKTAQEEKNTLLGIKKPAVDAAGS